MVELRPASPICIIIPIHALSTVAFACNLGLVTIKASVEIRNAVQFVRFLNLWRVMLMADDARITAIGVIGVDAEFFLSFPRRWKPRLRIK